MKTKSMKTKSQINFAPRIFAIAFAIALALAAIPRAAQAQQGSAASSSTESASLLQPIGIFAAPQGTAGLGDAYSFIAHTSDPARCIQGNVEFNLTSATPKYCSAPNTWTAFAGGSGVGTVTNVSCGALSPLFGCSVANASTAPAISFSLSSAAGNTVFGNFSGTSGAPSFGSLTAAMLPSSLTSNTSGNAATATALAATPSQCSGAQFATGIAANGNANCAAAGGSGTVNSGAQFSLGEYATAGTAISAGPTPPSADGTYFCGYNVTAAAAVAPSCWLNSLSVRAVTGTTSSDTILYNDAIVEYQGSVAVATSLPTPATLGNTGFYGKIINTTSGSTTAVTVTAASPYTFSSTASATLVVAQGQSCALLVDPAGNVWDDICDSLPLTAGSNITITPGAFGATISASGGLPSGTSGQLLSSSGGTSAAWVNQSTVAAGTAAALAATPSQCSGSNFATGIAANGNANCSTPSGGSTFSPATAVLFDDFMSNNALSVLGWVANGGGGSVQMQPTAGGQQATNHPGIAVLNSGGAAGGTDWEYYILGNQNNPEVNPTANSFSIAADLVASSTTALFPNGTTRFGLFDTTSMNQETPSSGVYFEAVNNGTTAQNWNCVVNNAGTPTSTSSGVTASTGTWHILKITFNSSATPAFSIDGSTVCSSLSASITSKLYSIAFDTTDNSNGLAGELIDYALITWNLTR